MSEESNLAALQRFGAAAVSGNFSDFYEVVAPDAVDHDPAPGQVSGPAGYEYLFSELRSAFPDFKLDVEHQ